MPRKQHRILSRQYDSTISGLFLDEGERSRLLVLREPCIERPTTCRVRSLTNDTESAMVNSTTTGHHEHEDEKRRCAECFNHATSHDKKTDLFGVFETSEQLTTLRYEASFELYMIEQQHSYACLETTADMFDCLCSQLGVFHCFKDMVIYLGQRTCEVEVAPPRPRWKSLGPKSDHGWELTYGLRWIEENDRTSMWSLRQSVIYNKTSFECEAASWIILAPTTAIKEDLDEFAARDLYVANAQQVALHLAFIQSSIICWRPYLIFLTEQVGVHVSVRRLSYHIAKPTRFATLNMLIQRMQNVWAIILSTSQKLELV